MNYFHSRAANIHKFAIKTNPEIQMPEFLLPEIPSSLDHSGYIS